MLSQTQKNTNLLHATIRFRICVPHHSFLYYHIDLNKKKQKKNFFVGTKRTYDFWLIKPKLLIGFIDRGILGSLAQRHNPLSDGGTASAPHKYMWPSGFFDAIESE